ncbi:MAG: NYN domain-containing protein [Fimbriimonadaceae bacterium]|nr:NYN domain-containing protein [Fimbriimonadaceae bacterium]
MERAAFYIDGFNLYHAVADLQKPHLKWLDLMKLARHIVPQKTVQVVKVELFTSLPNHRRNAGQTARHQTYLNALEAQGVTYTLGFFGPNKQSLCYKCKTTFDGCSCPNCGRSWPWHEEKLTDCNLATQIVVDTFDNVFDRLYLLSADADMTAPIKFVRDRFGTGPDAKKIITMVPPGARHAQSLLNLADEKLVLTVQTFEQCLLPEKLTSPNGNEIVRPPSYDPPKKE